MTERVVDSQQEKLVSNRREACRGAIRWLALGGVTLFSGRLLTRSLSARAGGSCPQLLACRDCADREQCALPQAVAARADRR